MFRFRDFELNEAVLELRRSGVRIELRPKPLFLLLHLVRNRHRVVSRAELVTQLWQDVTVSGQSLTTTLYEVRRALDDERSSDPCIATLRGRGYRFCAHVLQDEDEAGAPADPALSALERPPAAASTPFVDREHEMAQLRAALATAHAGTGRIVLLQGAPGIGKTRTVLELFGSAAALGIEALLGRAYPGDGAPPLWPWIEVLRGMLEARGVEDCRTDAGAEVAELARLLPALAATPVSSEPSSFATGQERWTLFDAIVRFLARSARRRPLLIALDDLHDADETSLDLVRFSARRLRELPLMIVGTYREVARGSSVERLLLPALREPGVQLLRLEGLQHGSVAEILERALGTRLAAPLLERVCVATGGNPFFVAEVARLLTAHGSHPVAGGASLPIPESLRDTVRGRIAEVTGAARELLAVAAVAGPRLHLTLLRRVLGLAPVPLLEALDACRTLDLLRQVGPGQYEFIHGFVRETLYEMLPASTRAGLHRDVGDALAAWSAASPGPYLGEIAHHFSEAAGLGRVAPAIHYARLAARRARSLCAPLEAVTQLRRALAALEFLEAPDPELRCEVQVELCEALFALDAPPLEVGREFEEAARLAQACERWDLFARAVGSDAYYQISKNLVSLIDPELAPMRRVTQARIEQALARLGDEHPSLRVALLLGYARLLERDHQSERAAAVSDEMLRLTDVLQDPGLRARVIAQRCYLHPDLERVDVRIDACRTFRGLAHTAGDLSMEIFGHMLEACLELQRGRRVQAETAALLLLGAELDPRISAVRPLAHFWHCLMAQLDGRLHDAQTWSSSAAQLGAELNFSPDSRIAVYAAQQWWLLRLQGQTGLLLDPWRGYVEDHPEIASVRIQLARLYAEVGRLEDARRELEHLGADPLADVSRDDNWTFFAAVAADVCADVADTERAPHLLALLEPFADRVAMAGWILTTHGAIARPLARLYALLGRRDDAEAYFERALALHGQLASPPLIAWTLLDHACVLVQQGRRGDTARAGKLRDAAVEVASSVGLHALAARAKSIL